MILLSCTSRVSHVDNNADALSRLSYTDTSLLADYLPQDIQTTQLQGHLVRPFLRAKETDE